MNDGTCSSTARDRLCVSSVTSPIPPAVIDMTLVGKVSAVDEPNSLAFTWGEEIVRFELTPQDSGT